MNMTLTDRFLTPQTHAKNSSVFIGMPFQRPKIACSIMILVQKALSTPSRSFRLK